MHEAWNRISKRAQWCEDLSIAGGTKEINSQDEVKITIKEDTGSPSNISKVPKIMMDYLIKGIRDLSLHVSRIQETKSSQPQKIMKKDAYGVIVSTIQDEGVITIKKRETEG